MNPLTADELTQFRLIVENARRQGWVQASAAMAAEQVGQGVRVTATQGPAVVEKTYPRDARWPFQLLRDLAWGAYRVRT